MEELIHNALLGTNVIPTFLLALILFYWITVILGVVDFDLFDFDVDVDVDLDGADDLGPFHGILVFLNLAELPFMLVFSIAVLIFWVISMFMVRVVPAPGGFVYGLLLIPAFIVSLIITKFITTPLKGIFKKVNLEEKYEGAAVVGQIVTLTTELKDGRLGQAQIERAGANILVNVKQYDEKEEFEKNEEAYVKHKDDEKNLFYIIKIKE